MNARSPYQGVWQIFLYNRRFYEWALIMVMGVVTLSTQTTPMFRAVLIAAALAAIWWLSASLAVSHYVYDRSPLYTFEWLGRYLVRTPLDWLNIHAGLDEAGHTLHALFPASRGRTLDIFDPAQMTEPSIREARRMAVEQLPAIPADWGALPLADGSVDVTFLLFAAHELRRTESRIQLFREVRRVLRSGGGLVLVEHLRDRANFLAFGPGFLHFFPARVWRQEAQMAGLQVTREDSITPFVKVFLLRRPA
jgi:SAM-dependent methyltransferase